MTDEKLIQAALKVDANQIHLPDGLLQRIEREADRTVSAQPSFWGRFRIGSRLEVLAACLVVGALLTFTAMGAFNRQPAAPPDGQGPVLVPAQVTLPTLAMADLASGQVHAIRPGNPSATLPTSALAPVVEAFNQVKQAKTRDYATTPRFSVDLNLRTGGQIRLSVIDQEKIFATVGGQAVEIVSPALVQALEPLDRFLGPFTVTVELVDGRGGYRVYGLSAQAVKVAMLVAGQVQLQVEAPLKGGWYDVFLNPPRPDELERAEIQITTVYGEHLATLPVLPPVMVGTSYSQNFEEVLIVGSGQSLQITGKTRLPEGRFQVVVRSGETWLTSQAVQAQAGSFQVEVPVPGGVPENAEVLFLTVGDERIEMALPVVYRQ